MESSADPAEEDMKNVKDEKAAAGKWEGWAWYYSVSEDTFRVPKAYYIKVSESVKIKGGPEATNAMVDVKLANMLYECGADKLCSYPEWLPKHADFEKDDFEKILKDKSIDGDHCVVINSGNTHILCLAEKSKTAGLSEATVAAKGMAVILEEIKNAGVYEAGTNLKGAIFSKATTGDFT